MYIEEDSKFRVEYAKLWTAMLTMDADSIRQICQGWGISDSDLFMSFQIFKPFSTGNTKILEKSSASEILQLQRKSKERVKKLLTVSDEC